MGMKHAVLSAALAAVLALAGPAAAQQAVPTQPAPQPRFALPDEPQLEPKAVDILKAMSGRLAAARSMRFTAVATYESLARTGLPLAYSTVSEVLLQRPDKLRVITPADGTPSEFYYDGRTMTAYTPGVELAAVAAAPPTIDAMLQAAYGKAAIYFPFTDIIVADPYGDLAPQLKLAFFVGQSKVVGGVPTDMVVIADERVQAQIWIGVEDRLPRRIEASFFEEGGAFRHVVDFSGWQLDPEARPEDFTSAKALAAGRMPFAPPGTN